MNKTPDSPQILPKFKKINHKRPFTPHIDLNNSNSINVRDLKKNDNAMRSFSTFMKQIVDSNNENFLTGEVNIIEYLISKNTGIPIEEVKALEKLSLKINKEFDLLNQFGQYLPNLIELRLNYSGISSIEDIGSSFKNLKILQVSNCNLTELSGIICFQQLEILDLSYNKISDLIELEMCSSIIKLNLKNNLISDSENITFLSGISSLKWLNLNQNPIQKISDYEQLIKDKLTELESLDKDEDILRSINILDESSIEEGFSNNKNSIDCRNLLTLVANKTKSTIASNSFCSRPATASTNINTNNRSSINRENLTSSNLFIQGVKSLVSSRVKDDFSIDLNNDNTTIAEKNNSLSQRETSKKRTKNSSRDKSIDILNKKLSNCDSVRLIKGEDQKPGLPNLFNNGGRFKVQKSILMKNLNETQEGNIKLKGEGDAPVFNKAFKKNDPTVNISNNQEEFKFIRKNIVIKSSKINID